MPPAMRPNDIAEEALVFGFEAPFLLGRARRRRPAARPPPVRRPPGIAPAGRRRCRRRRIGGWRCGCAAGAGALQRLFGVGTDDPGDPQILALLEAAHDAARRGRQDAVDRQAAPHHLVQAVLRPAHVLRSSWRARARAARRRLGSATTGYGSDRRGHGRRGSRSRAPARGAIGGRWRGRRHLRLDPAERPPASRRPPLACAGCADSARAGRGRAPPACDRGARPPPANSPLFASRIAFAEFALEARRLLCHQLAGKCLGLKDFVLVHGRLVFRSGALCVAMHGARDSCAAPARRHRRRCCARPLPPPAPRRRCRPGPCRAVTRNVSLRPRALQPLVSSARTPPWRSHRNRCATGDERSARNDCTGNGKPPTGVSPAAISRCLSRNTRSSSRRRNVSPWRRFSRSAAAPHGSRRPTGGLQWILVSLCSRKRSISARLPEQRGERRAEALGQRAADDDVRSEHAVPAQRSAAAGAVRVRRRSATRPGCRAPACRRERDSRRRGAPVSA